MAILPPKVLMVTFTNIDIKSLWSNPGDPYDGYPYQWQVQLLVTNQAHSNPYTATPYYYTSFDIKIGDWIASSVDGIAFQIIDIVSVPDTTSITVILCLFVNDYTFSR